MSYLWRYFWAGSWCSVLNNYWLKRCFHRLSKNFTTFELTVLHNFLSNLFILIVSLLLCGFIFNTESCMMGEGTTWVLGTAGAYVFFRAWPGFEISFSVKYIILEFKTDCFLEPRVTERSLLLPFALLGKIDVKLRSWWIVFFELLNCGYWSRITQGFCALIV